MQFRSERGFTLVELIVVIVIIGILAAVAVPRFTDLSDASKAAACKQTQATIETAAAVGYANAAIAGAAAYPASIAAMVTANLLSQPKCPQTNDAEPFTYSSTNGTVTCSSSSGSHAHTR